MLQDTNIVQNSVAQSTMPQIPLVNSTKIITASTPILNSQIPMGVATVGQDPQNTQQQVSLVPVVSAIQKPKQEGRPVVKVVPIYDDF